MNDEDFLRALESCELADTAFGHEGHLRAAYLYLRQDGFAPALVRICQSIRRYADHHGQAARYHETMTVAFASLIRQHLCERGDGGGWDGFARENPELFDPQLLQQFYPATQLASALARSTFLLPRGCDPRCPPATGSR